MADGTVNDLLQFIMQQNMGKISDYVLINRSGNIG